MAPEPTAAIADDEIADALRRICASAAFVRAPQLRRLLEYLVAWARDKKQNLKAYTIGVEALGRPRDFDPDQEAVVRVQATRLRHALEAYYASEGKNDRIRIQLPAGSYIAVFLRHEVEAAPPPAQSRNQRLIHACIAVLLITGIGLMTETLRDGSVFGPGPARLVGLRSPVPLRGNGLPTIAVEPFEFPVGPHHEIVPGHGLRRFIAGALARFETVNVGYEPRVVPGLEPARTVPTEIDGPGRYDLTATVATSDDHSHLRFQLVDHADASIVWDQMVEVPDKLDSEAAEEKIVGVLATTLLQPFGVIANRERGRIHKANDGDPRYRCVLEAIDALRISSETAYASARACLENTIRLDPDYSLAYSYLASINNRYFQYGMDTDPAVGPVLEKALWAAHRAIETNPESARAQFALFLTRFNLRDFDAANAAMTKARELNKYDVLMFAEYGGRLITLGKIDDGMRLLDQAGESLKARPCTHDFYAFIGHYARGELDEAARHADRLTCLANPYTFIAKALVAGATGDLVSARQALASVRSQFPIWRTDPNEALKRMFPNPQLADHIMRDLAVAGLQATTAKK